MNNAENLRFFMDEDAVPYPENEIPFPRTKEDEEFEKMIVENFHLVTKEMEKNVKWNQWPQTTPRKTHISPLIYLAFLHIK